MNATRQLPLALIAAAIVSMGCPEKDEPSSTPAAEAGAAATFLGRVVCGECHPSELASWRGSHHDLAMQEATEESVLGDFDSATFEHGGVSSTFSRSDGAYFVRTDGPEGELGDYRVAYTFGVEPLQQYLLDPGDGRGALQALSISWDTRPEATGGQRWFHLYDEPTDHTDPLHWTGPLQNWNYMCAECHSTGLERGYDARAERYATTWAEIDVSCEACHGPGSRHVAAARAGAVEPGGLLVDLERGGRWTFAGGEATAQLIGDGASLQTEACGRCHARRTPVAPHESGGDLHDAYVLALLEEPLYHADGQILDEVYVYGSFLQSKMHAAGVTCSDCHDPHGAGLLQQGNTLCTQCHAGAVFDVPEHHHHPVGGAGSACVDCHMPARSYMVVDPRRDHSFRVPRPDLGLRLGTPNACAACHGEEGVAWAAEAIAGWGVEPGFHYGEALHAGRGWGEDAEPLLLRVVEDSAQPPIVRASALATLGPHLSPRSLPAVERALADPHPLVRRGALRALGSAEPAEQLKLALPLADDPIHTVRGQAARLLSWAMWGVESETGFGLSEAERTALAAAVDEYRASLLWRAERPEARLHLGDLEAQLGDLDAAEASYRQALAGMPSLSAAAINLADLFRASGREEAGEAVLRQALVRNPDDAGLHQALGLALIRSRRPEEALKAFRRAQELDPEDPRHAYVHGIALHDLGRREKGIAVLRQASRRFPGHRELAMALRTLRGG